MSLVEVETFPLSSLAFSLSLVNWESGPLCLLQCSSLPLFFIFFFQLELLEAL